jgi:hypothetical protein
MKYELTKGTGNYEVQVVVDAKMEEEMKEGALKLAQKDFAFADSEKDTFLLT